jgi:predicted membrane protein
MKKFSVKKLALAGMFCALCVVGSVFSFPMFGSKCAPVQHMVNVLGLVLLDHLIVGNKNYYSFREESELF